MNTEGIVLARGRAWPAGSAQGLHAAGSRYRTVLLLLSASTAMSASLAGAEGPAPAGKSPASDGSWVLAQVRLFRAYPHLDRAYKLIAGNRLDAAAAELQAYLAIEPSDLNAHVTSLNILYRLKRYDDVLQHADVLLALDDGNAQARLFKGLVLQARHQDDEALAVMLPLLGAATADLPTRTAAATAAVDMALRRGRFDDALRALAALNGQGHDFSYRMQEGAALAGLNRYAQARTAYAGALTLAATPSEKRRVHQTLFYLAHKHNDPARALVHAEAIVKADPADATWVRALAMTYYLQKDDARALATIAMIPSAGLTAEDHFFEANLQLAHGEFGAAATSFGQVVKDTAAQSSRFRAYMGLGYAYAGLHQMRQAADAFGQAHRIQASDEAARALDNVSRMLGTGGSGEGRAGIARAVFVKTVPHDRTGDMAAAALSGKIAVAQTPRPKPSRVLPSARTPAGVSPVPGVAARDSVGQPASVSQQALLGQGYAEVAKQNDAAAVAAFESAVEQGVDTLQVYLDLGFAYTRLKRPDMARDNFLQALRIEPNATQLLYVARSYIATGQVGLATQYLQLARAEQHTLPEKERRAVLIELGNLQTKQEHFDAAAGSFEEALAYGADTATLVSLAYVRETAGDDSAALAAMARIDLAALPAAERPQVLQRLARLYQKTGNVDLAVSTMLGIAQAEPTPANYYQVGVFEVAHERAQDGLAHLKTAQQMDPENPLYAQQLGYLYKNQGAYADAAAMFEAAIRQGTAPHRLYQDLAYTYKQLGDNTRAIAWFKRSIDAKYDEVRLAARQLPAGSGRSTKQARTAPKAPTATMEPTATTMPTATIEPAATMEPAGAAAPVSGTSAPGGAREPGFDDAGTRQSGFMKVGYAAPRPSAGGWRMDALAQETSAGAVRDSTDLPVQADAVAQETPQRAGAQQVDTRLPAERATSGDDAAAADRTSITQGQDEELYRMRKEVRDLSRRFQFNVYESYRSKSQSGSVASAQPGFFNSGAIPSQGGVEFIYQPPDIGYQDGRIFQVFARGLWSNRPDSLAIAHDSLQGSVGARYKPFKTQDMFFSLEKLIKIGDQAQSDWLARASYAWTDGYELKPNQASWNQTTVYGDLGYFFPKTDIKALYAEVRQGRAFNFSNRVVVTPHVLLAGRSQRPDPANASYREAGVGVALKYLFNENRYEAERSSIDVWLQYRRSFTQQHAGGWVMTAALQF